MKQEEQVALMARRKELGELFDGVFYASLQSGLLVGKASEKAAQAVDAASELATVRSLAINARIAVEFPVDQG